MKANVTKQARLSPYVFNVHELHTRDSFGEAICEDIDRAKALVLIKCPFVNINSVAKLTCALKDCARRGVRVCVFVAEPDMWHRRLDNNLPDLIKRNHREFEAGLASLRRTGVHISIRADFHEKIGIIDEVIAWDGSLNQLSYYRKTDCINRWTSYAHSWLLLVGFGLNTCDECAKNPGFKVFRNPTPETCTELIVAQLIKRREMLNMSHRDLADASGVPRETIRRIENGSTTGNLTTMLKLYFAVGMSLGARAHYQIPAIENIVGALEPAEFSPMEAALNRQIVILKSDLDKQERS